MRTTLIRPAGVRATGPSYDLGIRLTTDRPLPADTRIELRGGNFRGVYLRWATGPVDLRVEVVAEPPHDWASMSAAKREGDDHDVRLLAVRLKKPLAAGESVSLVVHGTQPHHAPLPMWLQLHAALPDQEPRPVGERFFFSHRPGPATRLECRARASALGDGTHDLTLFATDALLNPCDDFASSASLHGDGVEGLPDRVELQPGEAARVTGLRVTADRPVRIDVEADTLRCRSNYLLPAGFLPHVHAFGELHWHCVYSSDGDRTQEAGYRYARDVLNLDVVAVTDHTPTRDWPAILDTNDAHLDEGRFVTLHAWEWSTARFGHVCFYFRDGDAAQAAGPSVCDWQAHPASHAWPEGTIGVPHHTNIGALELRGDGTPYWFEYDWSRHHERFRAVEVSQVRGNFEADTLDPRWGIVTEKLGASVRDALAMGCRLGFTAGTDNHMARPTQNGEEADGRYLGMTGFLLDPAEGRTRNAAWQSLNERRTYGTTGVPIVAHFEVAGQAMGGAVPAEPGRQLPARIAFYATDRITDVELVGDGRTLRRFDLDGTDAFDWSGQVTVPDGPHPSLYCRMRQADGHRAWASPVYFDRD